MTPSEQIDQYIAGLTDWRGKVIATLRRLMLAADPAVVETWKWRGAPVWECDGIVSLAGAFKGKVKWTFQKGAHVPDPDHLFNNGLDGNMWRAIDITEDHRLNEAKLTRLIKAAIAYNRAQVAAKSEAKINAKAKKVAAPAAKAPSRAATKKAPKKTAKTGETGKTVKRP